MSLIACVMLILSVQAGDSTSQFAIKWIEIDSSAYSGLSDKIFSIDSTLYDSSASPGKYLRVATPIADSQNLILVRSPTSKKGLTYVVDQSCKKFLAGYFFSPPDSSFKTKGNIGFRWNPEDSGAKPLVAFLSGGIYWYCANRYCINPYDMSKESIAKAQSKAVFNDSIIDSEDSKSMYNRQHRLFCELTHYLRCECGCLKNISNISRQITKHNEAEEK